MVRLRAMTIAHAIETSTFTNAITEIAASQAGRIAPSACEIGAAQVGYGRMPFAARRTRGYRKMQSAMIAMTAFDEVRLGEIGPDEPRLALGDTRMQALPDHDQRADPQQGGQRDDLDEQAPQRPAAQDRQLIVRMEGLARPPRPASAPVRRSRPSRTSGPRRRRPTSASGCGPRVSVSIVRNRGPNGPSRVGSGWPSRTVLRIFRPGPAEQPEPDHDQQHATAAPARSTAGSRATSSRQTSRMPRAARARRLKTRNYPSETGSGEPGRQRAVLSRRKFRNARDGVGPRWP